MPWQRTSAPRYGPKARRNDTVQTVTNGMPVGLVGLIFCKRCAGEKWLEKGLRTCYFLAAISAMRFFASAMRL